MPGIHRSLLFSFGERYARVAITLLSTVIVARLLTPSEVGVFVVGNALVLLVETFRDFGVGVYLVQERELTRQRLRTAFTVQFALSALLAAALLAAAGTLAAFYGEPGLKQVLAIAAVNFLVMPFGAPAMALLRRDMAFDAMAVVHVLSTAVNFVVVVALAATGFGYMSMAWASLAGIGAGTVAAVLQRPDIWIFRPSLRDWRRVLSFGAYSSGAVLLNVSYQSMPQMILGRILDFAAVGLYSRATMLNQLFDRLILDALHPVVLPAVAERVRTGGDLREPFLRALEYMTALQWPFLLCLALLADPTVRVLLGPQWSGAAPLVRILALASLCLFPTFMTQPVLVSIGRVRDTLVIGLITVPPSLAAIFAAAFFGLEAVAASLFVTAPFQVYVALRFIRRHIPFAWHDLLAATRKSALVALCAAAAPAATVVLAGFRFDLSLPELAAAGTGAALGWSAGLFATGHPLQTEVRRAVFTLRSGISARLLARRSASARSQ